jgi:hypothetical protein
MYPDYESFAYVVYPEFAIFALFVSGVSGVLASIVLKLPVRRAAIATGALLGAAVSLITVYALGHLNFENSFGTAVIVAVFLPVVHQFYRFRQMGAK